MKFRFDSTMVTRAAYGMPEMAPPVGLLNSTHTVRFPVSEGRLMIGTVKVLLVVSPSAHESVP